MSFVSQVQARSLSLGLDTPARTERTPNAPLCGKGLHVRVPRGGSLWYQRQHVKVEASSDVRLEEDKLYALRSQLVQTTAVQGRHDPPHLPVQT